ncbi:response regulator transcription factor [Neobacillus terrae]|uniref:response regulator transcription factor n=1 Tax=Neobacillus terrae TaxID=3034837 RepID=UPI0014074908|nr:response regulator transcription factor [Neobacillus terrae]NHM31903.1 response regulator transcription factor [Neobacillus terrae]
MNILLAEDDTRLGKLISHMLKKKGGFRVDWVEQGEDAYDFTLASHYDVVILDWMMPVMDGISVCRKLRSEGYGGPILMLTAKDAIQDRVEGLDAGADDYLVKPFEMDELFARIRALSRRNFAPIQEDSVSFSHFTLNRTNRNIEVRENEVQLSQKEFQLLDLLLQNKGMVLTREVILDRIWGYDADVSYKIVDATVKLLRKKLDADIIHSIRGVGYKLEG